MSRTKKGSKAPGYEFWSKRPGNGWVGSTGKNYTHRVERQQAKDQVREGLKYQDKD